jgi:conjugal transfer pilus assembly protein TraK
MARHLSPLMRQFGWTCGVAALLAAAPAQADQTLMATDGAQVDCQASAKDLTRISLVDDEFASVSKISTGDPTQDFSVVNEPVRGDIYLSVPDGFKRTSLSFFGTSKRGYVYKFMCRVVSVDATQLFVSNPEIGRKEKEETARNDAAAPGPQEQAVELMQAMYVNGSAEGYELRQRSLRPVYVGDLKVQMITEYRGSDLMGRVLRIENRGKTPAMLDETVIAPTDALAVSVANPNLAPGEITTAYLVSQKGGRQ